MKNQNIPNKDSSKQSSNETAQTPSRDSQNRFEKGSSSTSVKDSNSQSNLNKTGSKQGQR